MSLFEHSATGPEPLRSTGAEQAAAEVSTGGQLLLAALPVLLLPVHMETRFMDEASGPELWVRIYPDQIAVDTHEPELTDAEIKVGQTYWDALWRAGKGHTEEEKIPWRALATALGPQRAAWVALALTPTNLDQRPAGPAPPACLSCEYTHTPPLLDARSAGPGLARLLDGRYLCEQGGDTPRDEFGCALTPGRRHEAESHLAHRSHCAADRRWHALDGRFR